MSGAMQEKDPFDGVSALYPKPSSSEQPKPIYKGKDSPDKGVSIEDLVVRSAPRESWLYDLMRMIAPWFESEGHPLPLDRIKIGVGFTTSGARRKNASIGQCHYPSKIVVRGDGAKIRVSDPEGNFEIIIRIDQEETLRVAEILVHELCHVALPGHGHKMPFRKLAHRMGLKMVNSNPMGCNGATEYTAHFAEALQPAFAELGDYPHHALGFDYDEEEDGKKKKKSVNGKSVSFKCECCGLLARMSPKWADLGGTACNNFECEDRGTQMERV